jgi:predicted restriction endonuclease
MNDFILIILFIIFILFFENIIKLEHISLIHNNYTTIKFVIKNFLLALPFLTIYFKQDDIINTIKNNKNNKQNNSRNVNNSVKKYVASNQKWTCSICKNILDASYEIDHIIPLYKNGTNNIYNLQALCRNCHGKKTILDRIN